MRYVGPGKIEPATAADQTGDVAYCAVIRATCLPGGIYRIAVVGSTGHAWSYETLYELSRTGTLCCGWDDVGLFMFMREQVWQITDAEFRTPDLDEVLLPAAVITRERDDARRLTAARLILASADPSLPDEECPNDTALGYVRRAISDADKMFVWKRDEGQCVRCGSNRDLEFDHIIPVSMGGSNTARNLQLLCEPCNRAKGANLV